MPTFRFPKVDHALNVELPAKARLLTKEDEILTG
jgi:hypothetical protein